MMDCYAAVGLTAIGSAFLGFVMFWVGYRAGRASGLDLAITAVRDGLRRREADDLNQTMDYQRHYGRK